MQELHKINSEKIILIKKLNKEINNLFIKIKNIYLKTDNDINNSLSVISKAINFLNILLDSKDSKDSQNSLEIVENGTKISKILEIIKSEFAKILEDDIHIDKNLPQTYIIDTKKDLKQLVTFYNKILTDVDKNDQIINKIVIDSIISFITFNASNESNDSNIKYEPNKDPTLRKNYHPGLYVQVIEKENQGDNVITPGIIQDILTNSENHHQGIKVRLTSGIIGRVAKIIGNAPEKENIVKNDNEIIKKFLDICEIFKQYHIWHIYVSIYNKLQKYLNDDNKVKISEINELNKNFILSFNFGQSKSLKGPKNTKSLDKGYNPNQRSYGLIPVSNLLTIKQIAKLFNFTTNDTFTISDFIKLCMNVHDIIIIKKQLARGINYNILDLLDFSASKDFSIKNNNDDGITIDSIKRFDNIQYINENKDTIDFTLNYKYAQAQNNTTVIVLEELYPDKYHILSNNYFSKISQKNTLGKFINSITDSEKDKINRIDKYNNLISKKILTNMFLKKLPNLKAIKEKTNIDQKYLRYELYTNILAEYTKNTKMIRDLYTFSKLIHREEFGCIFSNILTKYYYSILDAQKIPNKVELYLSFIYRMNMAEKDFEKRIHDDFIKDIDDIEAIFFKSEKNLKELDIIFTKILKNVIDSIITNENNIYQYVDYKQQFILL